MNPTEQVKAIERDFIRTGFGKFTNREKIERAYACGASDERLNLCRQFQKEIPQFDWSDIIYGSGGD